MATFSDRLDEFPLLIPRRAVGVLFDGAISPKTLANHDSKGTGPSERQYHGNKVFYPRDVICAWMDARSRVVKGGQRNG